MDQGQVNDGSSQENGESIPVRIATSSTQSPQSAPQQQSMTASQEPRSYPSPTNALMNESVSSTPTVTDPPATNAPKKNKLFPKIIALLLTILVLIAAGFAAWLFLLNKDTETTPTTTSSESASTTKKEVASLSYTTIEPIYTPDFFPPAIAANSSIIGIRKQIFETLVSFEDLTNITPSLASSWTNPDLSTWIFKIKPGVKFHNGNTLNATIAKEAFQATMKANPDNIYTSTIKEVSAPDNDTLTITTTQPDTALLNKLTFIPIYDTTSKIIDSSTGTGPYTVTDGTVEGTTKLTLTSVPSYHGGTVLTKQIIYGIQTDGTKLLEDIRNKTVDVGYLIDQETIDATKKEFPKAKYTTLEGTGATGLYLNPTKSIPLQKIEVRRAIYKALDMKQVVANGGAKATVATQLSSSAVPGFNPAIKAPVTDVAAAKADLATAGYPNGFPLKIHLSKTLESLGNEIKLQLAQIGIAVELDLATDPAAFFAASQSGADEAWISTYTSDINDMSDVIYNVYQGGTYKNFYTNKKLDDVMNEAGKTFDQAKRLALLQDATKLIIDDAVFIPIRLRSYEYIVNKPVVLPQDFSLGSLFGTYFWKAYATE